MPAVKKYQQALLDAIYAIDGIIVVNGIEGQAISSPDPEQPLKVKGSQLAKLGLDLVSLLKSEMILPVTDQPLVDEALRYFEEVKNGVETSGVDNGKSRRVSSRRPRRNRVVVND